MSAALVVIAAFLALALLLGLLARRGRTMSLEQWSVGGRGFGTLFVFLLMAGEIYTTFTFLGASGWAYGKGAPTFYILCYGSLAYALSYFLLPPIWRYASEHHLLSQADFFVARYRSPGLGVLVALVGVAAILPYLVLQLKGLGIIVSEASYGRISPTMAVWLGTGGLVLYVVVSGVRGSAWTAVLKDIMILAVVAFMGVYLPMHLYGGYHAMFAAIERSHPGFLTLPVRGQSPSWLISTALLAAIGFYMWPHGFASAYTARGENAFRRSAVLMPLYQLVMLFAIFIGFAAILRVPGLRGPDADLALLRVSLATFPPALVGLIGGAGLLTALVPGSVLLLAAATTLAQNVYRVVVPGTTDRTVAILARALVPVLALMAVGLTLRPGNTIVGLLLMGYNVVAQLFPLVLLALPRKALIGRAAAFGGLLAGEATVAYLMASGATVARLFPAWPAVVTDLNTGVLALLVNLVAIASVSLLVRAARRTEALQPGPAAAD